MRSCNGAESVKSGMGGSRLKTYLPQQNDHTHMKIIPFAGRQLSHHNALGTGKPTQKQPPDPEEGLERSPGNGSRGFT